MKKGIQIIVAAVILLLSITNVFAGNTAQNDPNSIEQRLSDLESRTTTLEQNQPESNPANLRAYWKEGLNLDTEDGSFKLKIGGRLMTDWTWISEDEDIKSDVGEQEDGVEVRRARMYFSGSIYDNINYKLQIDFAGAEVTFKDAYIELTDFPLGKLKMGNFYEPFSLETVTSSKYITFIERGLPTVFSPERQTGFMLHDTHYDGRVYTAVGVFRETDGSGENIDDGGYHITGRITGLPIYENNGKSLLHVGAAYSMRNPDDSLRIRQRPEAHLTDRFVDTGTIASDNYDLLGLEAAWVNGPFSLQSEYMTANVDRMNASDVSFNGYYVQASYFLTGEHRPYKTSEAAFSRVKPINNYKRGAGKGAWELKLRYSGLDLNHKDINGGELNNITTGVNWYLNPNTKVMWDYINADADNTGSSDMFMMRLQFDF